MYRASTRATRRSPIEIRGQRPDRAQPRAPLVRGDRRVERELAGRVSRVHPRILARRQPSRLDSRQRGGRRLYRTDRRHHTCGRAWARAHTVGRVAGHDRLRPGHRRHRHRLQRRECRVPSRAPVSRRGPPRRDLAASPRSAEVAVPYPIVNDWASGLAEVEGLAGLHGAGRSERRRGSAAGRWCARDVGVACDRAVLPNPGCGACHRTCLQRRRHAAGSTHGRGHQPRSVAATLRRRPRCSRARCRSRAHRTDRRRHAARHPVSSRHARLGQPRHPSR